MGHVQLEQDLAPTADTAPSPVKRSAARPSEISKLASQALTAGVAPGALVRPSGSATAITGLEKPEASGAGSALAFAPRANVPATSQSRSIVQPQVSHPDKNSKVAIATSLQVLAWL